MAKAAPSKKSAKAVKSAAATGDKKKKKRSVRKETFNTYLFKVLKQVHPGEFAAERGESVCLDRPVWRGSSGHLANRRRPPPWLHTI